MRLTKKDYKLLAYLLLLLFLCWSGRFLLFMRPTAPFPLSLKWQIDLGRSTYERPAYHNGLMLFPANTILSSHWYGLEATSGQIVWSQRVRRNSFRRCLTDDYLVVSGASSLVTLEPKKGEIIWSGERAHTATCSKEVLFYSGVPRDSIYAFNLSTKKSVWSGTTPNIPISNVIYNPQTQELIAKESTLPGDIYLIEPETGVLKDSFDKVVYAPDEGRGGTYLVDRGELFIGGTVLNAQTGQIIHKEDVYNTNIPPTVTADTMYLSSTSVVAYDRANYEIKWVYSAEPVGGLIPVLPLSPVTVLDGVGYVIYSDVSLRAIDLEIGQELGYWQLGLLERFFWPVCTPIPFPFCTPTTGVGMTASEDSLFASFGDGKLYAFGE